MKWRKMTWALIIWSVLMLIWVIAGTSGANCGSKGDQYSKAGCEAGTGIGVGIVIFLWFVGFVVLSLIWFMTRPKDRPVAQAGHAGPVVQSAGPEPGWYPDPKAPGWQRYWNGREWTEHQQPGPRMA